MEEWWEWRTPFAAAVVGEVAVPEESLSCYWTVALDDETEEG